MGSDEGKRETSWLRRGGVVAKRRARHERAMQNSFRFLRSSDWIVTRGEIKSDGLIVSQNQSMTRHVSSHHPAVFPKVDNVPAAPHLRYSVSRALASTHRAFLRARGRRRALPQTPCTRSACHVRGALCFAPDRDALFPGGFGVTTIDCTFWEVSPMREDV